MAKRLLSEKEVEAEYGLSVAFLQRARLVGRGGIDFVKCGGKLVRYEREAIERYLRENVRRSEKAA